MAPNQNNDMSTSDGILPTPVTHASNQSQNFNPGRGRGHGYGNNMPQCHLCGKFGHHLHFTGVIDLGGTTSPTVNLCSAQREDSSELSTPQFLPHVSSSSLVPLMYKLYMSPTTLIPTYYPL